MSANILALIGFGVGVIYIFVMGYLLTRDEK